MICPGVKRPPPMGSELVRGFGRVRGEGVEGRGEGVLRGEGISGAIVAPSRLGSSPSRVVPVSGSSAWPHELHFLPFGDTCAPHFEQNMGGGDSTIASLSPANAVNPG